MQNATIPEPQGHPLVGNLPEFKKNPVACRHRWHREYGDIVGFRIGPQRMYLLSHPVLVEQALIEQPDVFVKMYDPKKTKGLQLVLGQGLVTSKGALWQQQRRLLQPVFQRGNVAALLPQMATAGMQMIQRWQSLAPASEVKIPAEMLRLTLEVLTRTMFSASVLDRVSKPPPSENRAYSPKIIAPSLQSIAQSPQRLSGKLFPLGPAPIIQISSELAPG
jgi:cytochrome P450